MADTDKPHEASLHKLREARKKGQVARSADVSSALVFIGSLMMLWGSSGLVMQRLRAMLQLLGRFAAQPDPAEQVLPVTRALLEQCMAVSVLFAVVALVCAVVGAYAQVGSLVAWAKLKPDGNNVNPGQGFTRMFSVKSLANLAKMVVKTALLLWVAGWVVQSSFGAAVQAGYFAPPDILVMSGRLLMTLFGWAAVVYCFMAGADYLHTRMEYMKEQRMTTDELRREFKDQEGDPYVRGRRRQMAAEEVMGVLDRIASARVLVHSDRVAVALAYNGPEDLPRVVARGEGEAVVQLRQLALQQGVAIVQNIGTAQRLYREVALDRYIERGLFAEVAEILRGLDAAEQA
jgi:type III secretion protein U